MDKRLKWSDKEMVLLKDNYFNCTKNNLQKLIPNKSWEAIKLCAQRSGLKRNNKNREISIKKNHNSKIYNLLLDSPESYYWIGFIFADGSIDHKRHRLSVEIAKKDKKHLMKLASYINCKNIFNRDRSSKFGYSEMVSINQTHEIEIPKIIKKFCFRERKTYNPPNELEIKNNDLFLSMFIGYIDGDGHIQKDGRIKVRCHYSWAKVLDKWFQRIWILSGCGDGFLVPKSKVSFNKDPRGIMKRNKECLIRGGNKRVNAFLRNKIKELSLQALERKWGIQKLAEREK